MHSNEALPEELLKERAKLYLAETEQESKQLLGYLLIFRLDNQWFGLPTNNIQETTHLKNGVVLPRVQTGVLGLIQQHSGFIPLIDLHYLLHLPSIKVMPNQSQKLVVMEGDNGNYGFLVNELSTVEAIYESYLVSQEESIEEKSGQHLEALQRELQGDPSAPSSQPKGSKPTTVSSGQMGGSHFREPNRQRQGLSIAAKISGGMGILTLIIVVISTVAISIMSEIRSQMTNVVTPAVKQTKLAEQMSLTLYDALLLEEDYLNTENEFKLTAASQELERLNSYLASATELAKDIEKHSNVQLDSFFAEMDQLLTNHINDVQEIGNAIQAARESNQQIRTESNASQTLLLGTLKDSRNRLSTTLEDHWITLKRASVISPESIVFGQTLTNLEERIASIQFNVLRYTNSDNLMQANTIRQQAQELISSIDQVRTNTQDEKIQLMLRDVRTDIRGFVEELDQSIRLVEQRTLEIAENGAFIKEKKASMIESANLLLKVLKKPEIGPGDALKTAQAHSMTYL